MKLNFRKFGSGQPLFILHGVFGSSDNWQTVGKEWASDHTVYLIDQRNHGLSPHDPEMNYEVMADDVVELMNDEGLDQIDLMGHSMGGKTAMHLATRYSDRIKKLIVVDITPKNYPPHHQQIFEGFHSINLQSISSRKEADEIMSGVISDFGVRQFILKNLSRNDENEFVWKINVEAIERNIENVGSGLINQAKFAGPTLFIGGGKSQYIQQEDHQLIKHHFPQAEIKMIAGAGHWVHAEKPAALLELVTQFLKTQ